MCVTDLYTRDPRVPVRGRGAVRHVKVSGRDGSISESRYSIFTSSVARGKKQLQLVNKVPKVEKICRHPSQALYEGKLLCLLRLTNDIHSADRQAGRVAG